MSVVVDDMPIEMYFEEFADSSINFRLRFWVEFNAQTDFLAAQDKAIKNLKQAFADQDIDIPFPVRTLDANDSFSKQLSQLTDSNSGS